MATDAGGFLGVSERVLAPAQVTENVRHILQRSGQIRLKSVRLLLSQFAVEADGFLRVGQCLLYLAQDPETDPEILGHTRTRTSVFFGWGGFLKPSEPV